MIQLLVSYEFTAKGEGNSRSVVRSLCAKTTTIGSDEGVAA